MEPFSTFCFAGIVFLALPLPLFASAALGARPSARRLLMPWVWGNAISGMLLGLAIVATPLPAWIALATASATFLFCGMRMVLQLAKDAALTGNAD